MEQIKDERGPQPIDGGILTALGSTEEPIVLSSSDSEKEEKCKENSNFTSTSSPKTAELAQNYFDSHYNAKKWHGGNASIKLGYL